VRAHLHDYHPAGRWFWLVMMMAGAAVAAWVAFEALTLPWPGLWPALAGLALLALASSLPVSVRLRQHVHEVSMSGVCIYALMALAGGPAAIIAESLDMWLAYRKNAAVPLARLLRSIPISMLSMAAAAALHAPLTRMLIGWGLPPSVSAMAALGPAALLFCTLYALLQVYGTALQNGARFEWKKWWAYLCDWWLADQMASAIIAGLIGMGARQFGPWVIVISALAALSMVLVLRMITRQLNRERQAQEARVAEAEREALLNQRRFGAAFTRSALGMAIVDARGLVVQANPALCALFAADESALIGQPFERHLHPDDLGAFTRRAAEPRERPDLDFVLDLRCRRDHDGQDMWVSLHGSPFEVPGEAGHYLVFQLHDITARQRIERQLHHIAFHDALTGLPNRKFFERELAAAVEASRCDETARFAAMFIDLDCFKAVNDRLGHAAGDQLLREVAQRLRAALRPDDLVARLGGDEFAVLLRALHASDGGLRLAQRVLQDLTRTLVIDGQPVTPGASIGITFSDRAYRSADEVLRDADHAMYQAKRAGRGRVMAFDGGSAGGCAFSPTAPQALCYDI
jgi:diguanylate cyclase (GGDEF)-like protein/PAS domain S-box-containing protein